jgi:sec-independent protein translocase protein TatA
VHLTAVIRNFAANKIAMTHQVLMFIGPLGTTEILVILFIVLLLFGGKKIPELMRGLGKGIREFNAAKSNISSEIEEGIKEGDKKKAEEKKSEN